MSEQFWPDPIALDDGDLRRAEDFRVANRTSVLVIFFDDIKGSTRLKQEMAAREDEEAFQEQVRRYHDRLLTGIITREGAGAVIKSTGDGFLAVFKEPSTAVARALEIQEALQARQDLKVRIGLDMGQVSVESVGGVQRDLFGRHVDWAARAESLAEPGHILVTRTVYIDGSGWLPKTQVAWKAHGSHIVKAGEAAIEVYEPYDAASGAPMDDIAAPSLIQRPDRCFGRGPQVAQLVAALSGGAACIVLGAPGIGKTTLTREAATDSAVAARFGPRRWFVELETASDAAALQTALVMALGLNPATAKFEHALAKLGEQPSLVILDNLETPWEADPAAVEAALRRLAAVPGLALLASLRGETAPHAPRWTTRLRVAPLDEPDARRLFRDIAPDIAADDPDLAAFLAALGGVPLAIELVAHRAETHANLAELWAEWRRLGGVLATRHGVARSRLTSLGHSIELSLRSPRLGEGGKRLFRLLGQLPAGIAAEDRAALLGDAAMSAAEELVAIGLAFRRDGRLDLLPPIRDHARRLYPPRRKDGQRWRARYLGLLRDPGAKIGTADGIGAAARLVPEFANLEAGLRAQLAAGSPVDAGDTLLGLTRLMSYTGLGSPSLVDALAAACRESGSTGGEAHCIKSLGDIALARSDHDAARQAYQRALPLYRQVGAILGEANCIRSLGDIALERSDHDAARHAYERALPLYRQGGQILGEANCIRRLGNIALARSDHDAAREAYKRALPLYRRIGDLLGEANCIQNLGDIALRRSDHDAAGQAYERALPLYRQVGQILGEANCILGLGNIALVHSDPDAARSLYRQALALYERIAEPYSIGWTHVRLAEIADGANRDEHVNAARAAWLSIDRPDLVARLDGLAE